jgi:D-glycero-D-manno-heptose 1,7-bisphosphate phosphatase
VCEEVGYLNDASRFRMFASAADPIRRLNEARLPVVVVTNQSGVGRGYFPDSLVHTVHELMKQQLAAAGAHVDGIYYCPHTSADGCECRKPRPGLLQRAAREHGLELSRSFVVGDRYRDVELARGVGSRGILVRTGYGAGEIAAHATEWPSPPDFVAADLKGAVDWILRESR